MRRHLKILLIVIPGLLLQSCYTLLYPPETLPQTVTTVSSEQVFASSLGGTGMYGWDPYWEPVLPFTSYHRGYGASYYSPYNYYDYYDPYYAPVYVVSETSDPGPARNFERDDHQGGTRDRHVKSPSVSSSFGSSSGSSGGMSTVAPAVSVPSLNLPVVEPSPNPVVIRNRGSDKSGHKGRPVRTSNQTPPKKNKESDNSNSDNPNKRIRIRK